MNAVHDLLPDDVIGLDDDIDRLIAAGRPHIVTITGALIRKLTRAIDIPWPGEDWRIVAEKCGVTVRQLQNWVRAGSLQISHRANAVSMGKRGRPVPVVYTPSPIDPNNAEGRAPHPAWGSLCELPDRNGFKGWTGRPESPETPDFVSRPANHAWLFQTSTSSLIRDLPVAD